MKDDILGNDSDVETSGEEEEEENQVHIAPFGAASPKRTTAVFKEDVEDDDPNLVKYDLEEPDQSDDEEEQTNSQPEVTSDSVAQKGPLTSEEPTLPEKKAKKNEVTEGAFSEEKKEGIKIEESNPTPPSSRFQLKGKKPKSELQNEETRVETDTKPEEGKPQEPVKADEEAANIAPEPDPKVYEDTKSPSQENDNPDQIDYGEEGEEESP